MGVVIKAYVWLFDFELHIILPDKDYIYSLIIVNLISGVCPEQGKVNIAACNYDKDGGRPSVSGWQEQLTNQLKLQWLRAIVVSVKRKGCGKTTIR